MALRTPSVEWSRLQAVLPVGGCGHAVEEVSSISLQFRRPWSHDLDLLLLLELLLRALQLVCRTMGRVTRMHSLSGTLDSCSRDSRRL